MDLYYGLSGNSLRALIALEECNIPFTRHLVDLEKGEQTSPEFMKINPMGKVPVLVDTARSPPLVLSQSGAIMLYTSERSGLFLPKDPIARLATLQWFLSAVSDVSPANAIIKYFSVEAPDPTEGNIEYLTERLNKLLRVFSDQISDKEYILEECTIADLALYPFAHIRRSTIAKDAGMTKLLLWYERMSARPSIQRALQW